MADTFDVTIIGTGPAGYVCAIRAAQLGMKVAVVEKRATHGGTCLNIGCIPSKALLHASELFGEAKHSFAKMGIGVTPSLDLVQMMKFKQEAIDGNTKGIDFLFKKNKITPIRGTAKILGPGKVQVDGKDIVETKAIIIATGSDVAGLKGVEIDEKQIVSSTGALTLEKVPETLVVTRFDPSGLSIRRRREQLRSTLRLQLAFFRPSTWGSYYGILKTLGRFVIPYSVIVAIKGALSRRARVEAI